VQPFGVESIEDYHPSVRLRLRRACPVIRSSLRSDCISSRWYYTSRFTLHVLFVRIFHNMTSLPYCHLSWQNTFVFLGRRTSGRKYARNEETENAMKSGFFWERQSKTGILGQQNCRAYGAGGCRRSIGRSRV